MFREPLHLAVLATIGSRQDPQRLPLPFESAVMLSAGIIYVAQGGKRLRLNRRPGEITIQQAGGRS